jgi:hypothetical protein
VRVGVGVGVDMRVSVVGCECVCVCLGVWTYIICKDRSDMVHLPNGLFSEVAEKMTLLIQASSSNTSLLRRR